MARKKFTINKETLLVGENASYYLTRIPQSQMQLYLLLDKKRDIASEDDNTIMAELNEDTTRNVIRSANGSAPQLEDVLNGKYQNDIIVMTPNDLERDYYEYKPDRDPQVRAMREQERQMRQEQAAEKYRQRRRQENQDYHERENQDDHKKKNQQIKNNNRQTNAIKQPEVRQQYYNKEQFQQIKLGVKRGLNVALYSNIQFSAEQMKELRMALKQGVDIRKYNNPVISAEHMRELRLGAENGVELSLNKLDQTRYNADQIHELRIGFEKGLNVNHYLNPSYTAQQMKEIRLGEQIGLDTAAYQSIHYTAEQMKSMRIQLVFHRIKDIIKDFFHQAKNWLANVISQKTYQAVEHMQASIQNREVRDPDQIMKDRLQDVVVEIKADLINSELVNEAAYDDQEFDHIISRHVKSILQEYETKDIDMNQAAVRAAKDVMQEAGVDMTQLDDKVLYAKTTEEAIDEIMAQQDEFIEEEFEMEM